MAPPKALLLDVMGTLVHDPIERELPAFFGLTLPELFVAKHPTAWIEFESGQIGEDEYLTKMFADGRAIDREGFRRMMQGAYRWLDGVEPLLGELAAAGVPMHTFTNYPVWTAWIEARLGLSRYVAWTFTSHEARVRKPSPAAFHAAAERAGARVEECLFVDDRTINVEAARGLGMPAVRFTDAAALRAALVEHGLLSGSSR